MIIMPRDLLALQVLGRYFILDRRRVQEQCFPNDKDGRVTRRRLEALADAGYIRRHTLLVASVQDGPQAPVYLLTPKGCKYLADELGDTTLLYKPVDLPHPRQLVHALALADFHILFDTAIDAQSEIVLERWINEADVVNAQSDPSEHYRLRTNFDGKITCLPDAAFLLNYAGRRTACYVELERGSGDSGTGCRQLAERKCPGYAELARQKIYLNHFLAAEIVEFRVLLIVPHALRRDAIRRAFEKKDAAEFRTDLWRFIARSDITPDTLLHSEICFRCGSETPERLTAAAGVRPGPTLPDTADTSRGRESADAGVADAGPAALLAGMEGMAEATTEVGPSMNEIRTSTDANTRD
jgi:hypothetical protein